MGPSALESTEPMVLLMTLGWRQARHGCWTQDGTLLGLCTRFTPFLLIFVPHLLLSRHRRGTAAAVLSTGCCFVLGLVVIDIDQSSLLTPAARDSLPTAWGRLITTMPDLFL